MEWQNPALGCIRITRHKRKQAVQVTMDVQLGDKVFAKRHIDVGSKSKNTIRYDRLHAKDLRRKAGLEAVHGGMVLKVGHHLCCHAPCRLNQRNASGKENGRNERDKRFRRAVVHFVHHDLKEEDGRHGADQQHQEQNRHRDAKHMAYIATPILKYLFFHTSNGTQRLGAGGKMAVAL